jgi:ATP-binding cassette subfamily B protein
MKRPKYSLVEVKAPHGDVVEERRRPLSWKLITRLFSYTRAYAKQRNTLIALVLLRSLQLPLIGWGLGAVINGAVATQNYAEVVWSTVAFMLLIVFTQVTFRYRMAVAIRLGESVIHDLRTEVYRHLQSMKMAWYGRNKLGRIISRMTSDIESMRSGVQDVFFITAVQAGQMLFAGGLMLFCDWVLFVVVLGMVPGLLWINRYFTGRLGDAHRLMQESFSRVTATVAESIGGIRVTQGFVRQRVNAGIFRELIEQHSRVNMGAARMNAILIPLLDLNSQFFIGVLLLLGGWRCLTPGTGANVGDLIQFFFLSNMFFQPIQTIGNQYNAALTSMAGAERVFGLLDTKPDWADPADAVALGPVRGEVEFRNIHFSYIPGRPVLHDITFSVLPGQTLALVGHTGSGKSSIINLLAKLYLPDSGAIFVDGHDIAHIRTDSLHRQMGLVQQTNFLFTGSVLDNLRVGKPSATIDDARAAALALGCLDMIEALPRGFQTTVGERGTGLSLGERQIVCFVRAMLADPRILILDEATSSIDSLTEHRIQSALQRLLANRTSFVVAHRLSTIRAADLVLVLDHGRIVERGTHPELIALGGIYFALHAQFAKANMAATVAAAPSAN